MSSPGSTGSKPIAALTAGWPYTPREIDDHSGISSQLVLAEFDGDGLRDIVAANEKGVFLLE
jgi:hypothetical protein